MVSIRSLGGVEVFGCVDAVTVSSKMRWISVAVEMSWVGSVERMSIRAVADSGMELMEVPPEMWPTLMVVRGSLGSLRACDLSEGVAEEEDGIGSAGVGPGVAAGTGDGDAEAETAEGSSDDGRTAAAFKRDGCGDAGAVGAALEEVTHSAKIAFALFAYVGGEDDGDGWSDVGVTKGRGDGEESGEAGSVVADSGGRDARAVFLFDGIGGGAGGEDGVKVCGEEDAGDGA